MNCPNCSNPIKDNEIYCSNCGAEIMRPSEEFTENEFEYIVYEEAMDSPKPKKSKLKIFIIILVLVVFLALCAFGAFFAWNHLAKLQSPEYNLGSGYDKLPSVSLSDDVRCEKIIYVSPDNMFKDMLGLEGDDNNTAYMIFMLSTDDDDIAAYCAAGNRIFSSHVVQQTGMTSVITVPMKNFNVSEYDSSLIRFAIKDDGAFYKVELQAEPLSMNSFFDIFNGGGFPSFPGEGFDIKDIM